MRFRLSFSRARTIKNGGQAVFHSVLFCKAAQEPCTHICDCFIFEVERGQLLKPSMRACTPSWPSRFCLQLLHTWCCRTVGSKINANEHRNRSFWFSLCFGRITLCVKHYWISSGVSEIYHRHTFSLKHVC